MLVSLYVCVCVISLDVYVMYTRVSASIIEWFVCVGAVRCTF